jgi:hypothetical protein
MSNIILNVPALNVRNMSYKGHPITIIMISNDTYVYERLMVYVSLKRSVSMVLIFFMWILSREPVLLSVAKI